MSAFADAGTEDPRVYHYKATFTEREQAIQHSDTKRNVIHPYGADQRPSPERRCSSRTFRYGYLVTT